MRITDLHPEVDPLTGSVRRDRWGIGLSAPDAAALEHALRVAEAWSGRVVAMTAGPATIEPVLREVSALGASVVRIPIPEPDADHAHRQELGGDEQDLAEAIVTALEPWGTPSLVVCGDRSSDRGTGALPAFLAHRLGAAQALGLVSLEVAADPDGDSPAGVAAPVLMVERRLDGGWRERLRVPLPAVCSVEGAGTRLRRASLAGALAAQASVIRVERSWPEPVGGSDQPRPAVRVGVGRAFEPRTRVLPAPPGDDPRVRLLTLTGALVAHDPPTVIGPVGAQQAADALFDFLERHGYLDHSSGTDPDAGEIVR